MTNDKDLPKGRTATLAYLCSPEFRKTLKSVEIVFGRDENTGNVVLVFGRSTVQQFLASGGIGEPRTIQVPILQHTDELEALIAAVSRVKGHHDYTSPSSASPGGADTKTYSGTEKMAYRNNQPISPDFPHEMVLPFLAGDDSQEAEDRAAQWMYANFADIAYAGYRRRGRGLLIGPLASDKNGIVLSPEGVKAAAARNGELIVLQVNYHAINDGSFEAAIPEDGIRKSMLPGLNSYDPERQVAILLLRDGNPARFVPGLGHSTVSPPQLYEARKDEIDARKEGKPQ